MIKKIISATLAAALVGAAIGLAPLAMADSGTASATATIAASTSLTVGYSTGTAITFGTLAGGSSNNVATNMIVLTPTATGYTRWNASASSPGTNSMTSGANGIPAADLALNCFNSTYNSTGAVADSATVATALNTTAMPLATYGGGSCVVDLTVPAGQVAGSYTGTITITDTLA